MLELGATQNFEIETYTWSVLPMSATRADLTDGIADEYRWVMSVVDGA